MEDNTSGDDEVKDSPTAPNLGNKKLKLNDGSSHDSPKEADEGFSVCASNDEDLICEEEKNHHNDENVDSGVSADKSESTCSEDRTTTTTEGPSNEVVNIAPSSSNVRTILVNFRTPKNFARNYRKRKTPDSDGNDSSTDSDDMSTAEESTHEPQQTNDASETESGGIRYGSSPSMEGFNSGSTSSSSDGLDHSDDDLLPEVDESDEDEAPWNDNNDDGDKNERKPSVLTKIKPKHNYLILREIINREMGLTFPHGKTTKSDVIFERAFYGSLHAVYRLKRLHQLYKHKGCVNSINFHPEGQLLASGSDDTNVMIWDWARAVSVQTIKTGHKSNVFQSKFLHLNARSQLNIVTCARDGQVRLIQCHPSGGNPASRKRLCSHSRAAHKLHVSAHEPHVVISAGEDGLVMQCDVRADHATRLIQVKDDSSNVPLYSVCGHPLDHTELIVAGRDKFVRVYDRRKPSVPKALYCPGKFEQHEEERNARRRVRMSLMHLTCAVYSHDGSEILASYNDEDIYLFDAKNDVYDTENPPEKGGFSHHYSGHKNSATFKGVAFFGPKSQYIVSGSDCSNIYIWEKNTEAIVQWMPGDVNGVVNCIEAHPRNPVLATSGLDKDIKIWVPTSPRDPTFDGLEKIVRENASKSRSPLFNDFLPSLYSAWHGENRLFSDENGGSPNSSNIEFDGNVCTAF